MTPSTAAHTPERRDAPAATQAAADQAPVIANPATVLLAELADASEALTEAIVAHDYDRITAVTADADSLIQRLEREAPGTPGLHDAPDGTADAPFTVPDPIVTLLAARIGAAARRNALLLERAWATDAELLRLLAAAARGDVDAAAGLGGGTYTQPGAYAQPGADPEQPAGWLDRQA